MSIKQVLAWAIPSRATRRAYLLDALYSLLGSIVFGLLVGELELGAEILDRPLAVTIDDLQLLGAMVVFYSIVAFFSSVSYGLLGGLAIRRLLHRRAKNHVLTPTQGLRIGACVGALTGILLDAAFLIPSLASSGTKFLPSYGYFARAGDWSGATIIYVTMVIWGTLIAVMTTVAGALRGQQIVLDLSYSTPM